MRRAWSCLRDTGRQSAGECLLRIGRLAGFFMRHGASMEQAAAALCVGRCVCRLALVFFEAPDGLKLRALVEDWTLLQIRSHLRQLPRAIQGRARPVASGCGRRQGQGARDRAATRPGARPSLIGPELPSARTNTHLRRP